MNDDQPKKSWVTPVLQKIEIVKTENCPANTMNPGKASVSAESNCGEHGVGS